MRQVKPEVYLIAQTQLNGVETRRWLNDIGATKFEVPLSAVGTALTVLSGKRCYMSFQPGLNPNVTKVRDDLVAFIDNILKVGHGSVLEHTTYTFALEGISRVLTAELNRHRAGMAISEGSMRYIRFDDIPYWLPESIRFDEADTKEIRRAKLLTQSTFEIAFRQMEENYDKLLKIWEYGKLKKFADKKKLTSMFRRIIGIGVVTGGVWTGNLRALRHVFTMRCSEHAEEEICLVASMMLERMIQAEPEVFGDFEKVDGHWRPKHWKV